MVVKMKNNPFPGENVWAEHKRGQETPDSFKIICGN